MKFAAEPTGLQKSIERALLSTSVEELRRVLRMVAQQNSARLKIINDKLHEIDQWRMIVVNLESQIRQEPGE